MNEPNPFAPLGLPATWSPLAPHSWRLGQLDIGTPDGPQRLHVVVIDTPAGRVGLPLNGASARAFIDQLSAQISGIHVARTLPPSNGEHL